MLPWSRRLAALVLVGLLSGCASQQTSAPPPGPPPTPRGEPIDSGTVGRMVDQMAQAIVDELPMAYRVAESEYRQYLALGPISVAGFSEPGRFGTGLDSLRTKLMQNRVMRDNFTMVPTMRTEADAIMTELAGGSTQRYADPVTGDAVDRIDPRDLLLLTGRFQRFLDSPDRKAYRLLVFVDHPQSRERVWSHEFERSFVWDQVAGRWVGVIN